MGKLAIPIFFVIVVLWLIVGFLPGKFLIPERAGQFGDMFGGVNALFSGLAFAGLLITLLMQREELKLQRDELQLQRDEMRQMREQYARSAEAQEGSEELLRQQAIAALVAARINALQTMLSARTERSKGHIGIGGTSVMGTFVKDIEEEIKKLIVKAESIEQSMLNAGSTTAEESELSENAQPST